MKQFLAFIARIFSYPHFVQKKEPLHLKINTGLGDFLFPFYNNQPQGYSGYQEYFAMNSDIRNDLYQRQASEQYWLVGFALGFIKVLVEQYQEDCLLRFETSALDQPNELYERAIVWIDGIQSSGTDSSGPSTHNLYSGLCNIHRLLIESGPVLMNSHDYNQSLRNSLNGERTNDKKLPANHAELLVLMEEAKRAGDNIARTAVRSVTSPKAGSY
jgi:hypothetical protein